METDVTLLADVFETFRKNTLDNYKLDPAHFMTAPGLSFAACLRMTKVKLELLTDPDMYMFIDMPLVGGFSAVTHPYAKANHPQCTDYNRLHPLMWILYIDANNLYGYAMRQYLPTGGFEWVTVEERENWAEFIMEQNDEQEEGYMLEVDLEYPQELQRLSISYIFFQNPFFLKVHSFQINVLKFG